MSSKTFVSEMNAAHGPDDAKLSGERDNSDARLMIDGANHIGIAPALDNGFRHRQIALVERLCSDRFSQPGIEIAPAHRAADAGILH